MRREFRECFFPPPRVSNPDMHHGTCVTHVPWCMPGSLTSSSLWSQWQGKNTRHPGACATHNFMYLMRGPWAWFQFGDKNDLVVHGGAMNQQVYRHVLRQSLLARARVTPEQLSPRWCSTPQNPSHYGFSGEPRRASHGLAIQKSGY